MVEAKSRVLDVGCGDGTLLRLLAEEKGVDARGIDLQMMEQWRSRSVRVGPKSSLIQTKLSEHETNRGEAEKSECVSGEIFEILGQAATASEPRDGALDSPASRQKLKPFRVIGAFDF